MKKRVLTLFGILLLVLLIAISILWNQDGGHNSQPDILTYKGTVIYVSKIDLEYILYVDTKNYVFTEELMQVLVSGSTVLRGERSGIALGEELENRIAEMGVEIRSTGTDTSVIKNQIIYPAVLVSVTK